MTSWPLKSTFYYEGIMNAVLLLARLPLWIYAFPECLLTYFTARYYYDENHYEAEQPACTFFIFFFLYLNYTLTLIAHHYQAWQKLCCSLILERVLVVNSGV